MEFSTEPRHPIQVVARRAGLTADVLRAWERRYEAVTPGRSTTGRRRYSDLDVERLRLIRLAIGAGRRVGQVARLGLPELQQLVAEDRAAEGTRTPATGRTDEHDATPYLREVVGAATACDPKRLRLGLERACSALPPLVFLESVARPLMYEIGRLWDTGEMSAGYEHLASGLLRQTLMRLTETLQPGDEAPLILVATPAQQRHELGALLVTAVAALEGWRTMFLSGDLPAQEIARVAEATRARAVAVSITTTAPNIRDELMHLGQLLGEGVALLVGGQASQTYEETIRQLRGVWVRDVPSLRAVLQALVVSA